MNKWEHKSFQQRFFLHREHYEAEPDMIMWVRDMTGRDEVGSGSGGGTAGLSSLDTYKAAAGGGLSHITLPRATLDLSSGLNATLGARGLELSTLV
jgi:hypothetical protein